MSGPLRILVVDDHPSSLVLTCELLEDAELGPLESAGADSPAAARALVAQERFDVALVDFQLGLDDGLSLGRELLQGQPAPVVLLLTGWPDPALADRVADAGLAALVPKQGLDGEVLGAAIRTALGRPAAG